jgi:radical SAM protein with 4Fe4S-binding SPASM domain
VGKLGAQLLGDLEKHGFFGPPREAKPNIPSVQIQLTNDCNLECHYCCTNSGRARAKEITRESMLDVIRRVPSILGEQAKIAILGGEPLLVPWAVELAGEVVKQGMDLTIFTNGVPLADERLARQVAELVKKGVELRVSLAGPSAATCDALSAASRFEAAVRGVNALWTHGARAKVDLMIIPQNVEDIARELPRLRKRLPGGTSIDVGVLYLSGREKGEHMFESRAALEEALDYIAFEAGETIPAPEPKPVMERREGCSCALGNHVHVRSDGALFNCFKMEEKVGELATTGFEEAARTIRENPHRAVDLAMCADCALATLCGGGCRSENLLYTGDPDVPACGEWRVRVICEMLAEDRVSAVEWPVPFLLAEARARGIETPEDLVPKTVSRHLIDV